jgi:hypothetical protein
VNLSLVIGPDDRGQICWADRADLVGLGPLFGPPASGGLVEGTGDGQRPVVRIDVGPTEGAHLPTPGSGD